jgi:Transposase zinc-binding domain/Putative transposase
VADIFRHRGPAWRASHAGHVSLGQLKVMSAIERCRTAALGGHVERCEACAHLRISYNSCGNRHCPKCQAAAAKEWLADRQAELLPVPYFHVVFTLPGPIADIAYQNKTVVYDLLLKTAAETLITIAADPKHLGARIGLTAVLHTWGSALTHHPHAHIIVPGGGFSLDGQRWIVRRPGFFLSVRVLSRLFRRLFLERLTAAYHAGRLQFFADQAALAEPAAFQARLAALRKIECRVGEDVATLTPHRPGRADFPHPVLHERGSLAAAYPWRIRTEGSGRRARSALKRAHGTAPPRCRRDNHLRQTSTT